MRILLFQLDGKIPNLALMRIAAHHRQRGDEVELRVAGNAPALERRLGESPADRVYASAIFRRSVPLVEHLVRIYPAAIIGGTAVDPPRATEIVSLSPVIQREHTAIEKFGITTLQCDYSDWPNFQQSIGFTQRGCRLSCDFCGVPGKEGKVRAVGAIHDIWRGDPYPREVLLLDNDFFGQPQWRDRIREIQDGGFKVSFNQGINCRCLSDAAAEAIASVDYRDDSMKVKRIYTAWDSKDDEENLIGGLSRLVKYGVNPDHIMVYMLIGFWKGETHDERDHRRRRLREFGARPYPMPYQRTPELVGFQRWVVGAYDKPTKKWPNGVPWASWVKAKYQPANLGTDTGQGSLGLSE